MNHTKTDWRAAGGFLLLSIFLMTFCSMASFLFPLHTWVDQNCFLTVGRAMVDGKVLYRDIYEQKGPLLYALHALAALVDKNGFFGVYLIEILNFTWLLYWLFKLASLFRERRFSLLAACLTGLVIATTYCFSRGDNAEELCLPMLAVGLYDLLRYTNGEDAVPSRWIWLRNGLLAGLILWIKFTLLGFFIAWVAIVFVTACTRRQWKAAFAGCCIFLGGMLLTMLPWLLYFAYHDALYDFFYVYFYSNIFLYSKSTSLLIRVGGVYVQDIALNPIMTVLSWTGVSLFAYTRRWLKTIAAKIALPVSYFGLYFFAFVGGTRYRYYLLIMTVFALFGMLALLDWLQRKFLPKIKRRRLLAGIGAVLYLAAAVFCSNCRYYYNKPDSYYPQVQFAQRMREETDTPTLLNYGFLDGGFYLMADAPLPDTRFFCRLNIPRANLPAMYEGQDGIIAHKGVEFVVVRYKMKHEKLKDKEPCAALFTNYKKIADAEEPHDGYHYELYQRT